MLLQNTFRITYHGATDTQGARITIKDTRFNQRVTIPWDYAYNDTLGVAEAYLKGLGYTGLMAGDLDEKSYIIMAQGNTHTEYGLTPLKEALKKVTE